MSVVQLRPQARPHWGSGAGAPSSSHALSASAWIFSTWGPAAEGSPASGPLISWLIAVPVTHRVIRSVLVFIFILYSLFSILSFFSLMPLSGKEALVALVQPCGGGGLPFLPDRVDGD